MKRGRRWIIALAFATAGLIGLTWAPTSSAATPLPAPPSDFSLQITPSPLVATVEPGKTTQLQVQVHNSSSGTEYLKIETRSFTLSNDSNSVKLSNDAPASIASWISFSAPTFTVLSGQTFTEQVSLAVPKDAGFSYSFALLVSRQNNPAPVQGGRAIKGAIAVFALVNIDRPGATRQISVARFASAKHIYEYLPATLSVTLKNTGNTIIQPYGNFYVERGENSKNPLAALTVNSGAGYVLPGVSRTFSAKWTNGFPAYHTVATANGGTKQQLVWNWGKLSSLRIGRYTAQLVAVYNDGQHDVPIEGEVTFWVIPWKILLGLFIFVLLIGFGLWSLVRKLTAPLRRKFRAKRTPKTPPADRPPATTV